MADATGTQESERQKEREQREVRESGVEGAVSQLITRWEDCGAFNQPVSEEPHRSDWLQAECCGAQWVEGGDRRETECTRNPLRMCVFVCLCGGSIKQQAKAAI